MNHVLEYFSSFTTVGLINLVLAVACIYLALRAALKLVNSPDHEEITSTMVRLKREGFSYWSALMRAVQQAETRALICGLITLMTGALGYTLGQTMERWQSSFDLLFIGGIVSLLLANRRADRHHAAQSIALTASIWVTFFLTVKDLS